MDRILPRPVAFLTALLLGAGVIAMIWAAFRQTAEDEVGFSDSAPLVIVDAGHGGEDGGTVVFGVREKDVTIDLALKLERELVKRGVRVEMTRRDDSTVSLADRVALAAKHPGAAFVSLHLNRFASPKVRGAEVYISTPEQPITLRLEPGDKGRPYRDGRSAELGRRILEEIGVTTDLPVRDVRESRMFVTREAPSPSVLVECGFLSNPSDAMILSKAEGRKEIARAIAAACDRYFRETRENRLLGCSPWSEGGPAPVIAGPEGEP
ncbi:MAG: N-acetylmuramoyl-L-alanine amidase [Verrucomicrobiales bacterium]